MTSAVAGLYRASADGDVDTIDISCIRQHSIGTQLVLTEFSSINVVPHTIDSLSNLITPLNRYSLYSLAFQNTLSITALEPRVLSVEMADQVLQPSSVDILCAAAKGQTWFITCATKG